MTRKDYVLIASAIRAQVEFQNEAHAKVAPARDVRAEVSLNQLDALARSLANRLRDDNPRFDINRFLDACGV